jgi:GH15 family glucan-1,4-alpha-glucosidase
MSLTEKLVQADATHRTRPYLPIAEHGLIGNLHTVALVGSDGTIDWWCAPRFDSPSVFASIVDRDRGGYFRIAPEDSSGGVKQLYLPDTNVLLSRFFGSDGVVEVTDFMPVAGDGGHRSVLIRQIRAVKGEVPVLVEIAPRFDYGRELPAIDVRDDGATFSSSSMDLELRSPIGLDMDGSALQGRLRLAPGKRASFVLYEKDNAAGHHAWDEQAVAAVADETVRYWRAWVGRSSYRGRWREMVHRSALTLKLLTYSPTGAIVAAATMGLPETLGGERNWDYRYTWMRDAAFSLRALLRLGFTDEAEEFMRWLVERFSDGDADDRREGAPGPLQIMYGIDGRSNLPEQTLTHLSGYQNSSPVRLGNEACKQLQLDIYGELIDSVYLFNKRSPIHHEAWVNIARIVDWVCENWDQPDAGIWETRGECQRFTYSRLMCWVAVERALRIARQRGLPADEERWRAARDAIYARINDSCWSDPRQAFVQHEGSDVLDASVLRMPLVKFVAGDDPRWLSTLDAVTAELVSDGLVYRYNPSASPDGLAGSEGTFSICSFWWVEALTRAGRLDEAQLAFEKMLTYANHVGLYSEQIGPLGEALGNFPQAFTHLALINCASNLDRALG